MDLDKELKDLLFCLLRENDWVTGEELAKRLGWNRKKVQQNMQRLTKELGDKCSIEIQKNKGYLLMELSDELKAAILQDTFYNRVYFSMDERRTMLVLALLFRDGYVSMDRLAEEYYLSKTAVFEEIRHMKRWFGRIEGLQLEVSAQKGIKIHGTEREKRFCCAVFVQLNILKLTRIEPMAVLRYQGILKSSSRVLKKALLEDGILISGEDFSLLLRYIGITQMRSSQGYILEESGEDKEPEGMGAFFEELSDAIGYSFSVAEKQCITEIIRFSNVAATDYKVELNPAHTQALEKEIAGRLGMEGSALFKDKELLGQNIDAMLYRISCKFHMANYYDKDIQYQYPLLVHLANQAFQSVYGRPMPWSDVMDMAAYLGGILANLRFSSKIRVLLAGNQNFQLLWHIRSYTLEILSCVPKCFDFLPCYALEDCEDECSLRYDLLLTTEPEVRLRNRQFLLIPVIMTEEHITVLSEKIGAWKKQYQTKVLKELERDMQIRNLKEIAGLSDILSEEMLEQSTRYVLNKDTLIVIYTSVSASTGIQKVLLQKSFSYDFKPVTQIIIVQFNESEPGIVEYFKAVSHMLQVLK